ncbi:MAG: family 10 glycosylhydrolase [bacterium]|nr:family 10 glycosylhydrolase [bacterium]
MNDTNGMFHPTLCFLVAGICLSGTRALVAQAPSADLVCESRGVWLDKAQMLEGRDELLARLDRLRGAGFNTIYVAMQVRGAVMYPGSQILPQYTEARHKDPHVVDWLIPAIRARGLQVEAWTEFGFYSYWTPDAEMDRSRGAILDRWPQLTAIDRDGKQYLHNEKFGDFYSLCPSHPRSQEILVNLYLEMLDRYDFDGLHLDRIRYPDGRFCYCDHCRGAFGKDAGLGLTVFPATSEQHNAFVRWRKDQLTRFMAGLSQEIRRRFADLRITSAVVPPNMIDEKGQDWPTWIERGYLDAAVPMLYATNITESMQRIRRRLAADTMLFVGLDAGQGISTLTRQIAELRGLGAVGLTIWYSGTIDALLPDLRSGLFATPAVSPLYSSRCEKTGPTTGTTTEGTGQTSDATP